MENISEKRNKNKGEQETPSLSRAASPPSPPPSPPLREVGASASERLALTE